MPLHGGSTGASALHTPNGANSGTSNGDYVIDAAGISAPYRYFVEMLPGVNRLVIEMFDADTGLGGSSEDTAGRDRDRGGYDSTFTYQLIGPDGSARNTAYSTSNSSQPAGSDNAWTTFFDANGGESFADDGTSAGYSSNSGNRDFAGNWSETGDSGAPGSGDIQASGPAGFRFNRTEVDDSLQRTANLGGFTTATLSFEWAGTGMDPDDGVVVEVLDAPAGNVTQLGGPYRSTSGTYTTVSVAVPANRITSTTTIRFRTSQAMENANDTFYFRDVRIVAGPIPAGHWEIRVDSTVGDDINALGLRAHDGTSGSGGTELNVYLDSFAAVGVNPPNSGTNQRDYDFHPYVTSGCNCYQNDFDFDRNSGTTGNMTFTSRDGSFTQAYASASLSQNNDWNRNAMSGWTSDQQARGYGIWSQELRISSYIAGGAPNGNYATIWASNSSAAATPTANPQANAFRTYLQNDAGAAPAKPYVEQVVTARGAAPAVVGQTKRFTITVKVVNPTARAITFSALNTVTANVPGGAVVYGGNAMVAQGSITSQPSVGGSGNITWNPGSLASGATAILAYDVNVTPTSAGQRIPVTATPASGNGTRARWIDETGNTTQARATFTFGPLCELAVTENMLTPVVISSFNVAPRGQHVDVEWTTSSEIGTVGFNLYRMTATGPLQVNDELLVAGSPQGGRYRFKDRGVSSAGSYLIEEITALGERHTYGPFASLIAEASILPESDRIFDAEPHGKSERPVRLATQKKSARPVAILAGVSATGLVRLDAATIASALGMPAGSVASDLRKGRFTVSDDGDEVPWFPAGDALVFFGRKGETIYSDERMYRIEPAKKASTMEVIQATPTAGAASTFTASLDIEQDRFAATALPLDPENDYWFWESVIPGVSGSSRKVLAFDAPGLVEGPAALQIRLQGAMSGLSHRAALRLNGAFVGEVEFSSLDAAKQTFTITGSLLRPSGNELEVSGTVPTGAAFDVFYVDGLNLRYTRIARAGGASIDIQTAGGTAVVVEGVGAEPVVLDTTDPRRPSLITGAAIDGGNVSMIAPSGVKSLHIAPFASIAAPASLRTTGAAELKRRNGAQYVVIAPAELMSGAEELAMLRRRGGLLTAVVSLDQIYDEFSGGNVTPHAIREFIAWTQASWWPAPRYVALAGTGTYDYRELTRSAGHIPPLMKSSPSGIFAADAIFGDVRGNDGIPDVAIGRIPVSTNAELHAYVEKLERPSRPDTLIFASDARDRGADFAAASDRLAGTLAAGDETLIAIDELGVSGARTAMLSQWQRGPALVNWFGHGGLDRLSASLLTTADVPLLTSDDALPVVVAMTCTINRFELGTVRALGAELVRTADAGALAVWSSSGPSAHGEAVALDLELMRAIKAAPDARIGDLFVSALAQHPRSTTTAFYLLLGDPAISLVMPQDTTNSNPIATGE